MSHRPLTNASSLKITAAQDAVRLRGGLVEAGQTNVFLLENINYLTLVNIDHTTDFYCIMENENGYTIGILKNHQGCYHSCRENQKTEYLNNLLHAWMSIMNVVFACVFELSHSFVYRKILLIQSKVLSDEQADRDTLVAKLTEIKGLNSLVYTQVSLQRYINIITRQPRQVFFISRTFSDWFT